jgi:hypothetical protein
LHLGAAAVPDGLRCRSEQSQRSGLPACCLLRAQERQAVVENEFEQRLLDLETMSGMLGAAGAEDGRDE